MFSDQRRIQSLRLMALGASLTLAIGFSADASAQSGSTTYRQAPTPYQPSTSQPPTSQYRPVPSQSGEVYKPATSSDYKPGPQRLADFGLAIALFSAQTGIPAVPALGGVVFLVLDLRRRQRRLSTSQP